MQILTPEDALKKRTELVELGYTAVPCIMEPDLLNELQTWSDDVFQRLPVDPKLRYQGSDIHVVTERRWEQMPTATPNEIQALDDRSDHPAFADRDDAVDVPLAAGDLVIADARLMHGAWPNQTDQRRTLVLAWHGVFPFPKPPSWWTDEIPDAVTTADPEAGYEGTRTPSAFLQ